jgi:hypothetical protein
MRIWPLWLTSAACFGAVATAQEAPPPLPNLRPGAAIRLEASASVGHLEGRFERYAADSLIMRSPAGARTPVPRGALNRLWVQGHSTKTGAIVGAAIGIVAGALIGGVGCGLGHSDDGIVGNEGFDAGCAAAGAGIGVVVGGGAGAGIGALIPKWRLRYQAVP